MLNGMDNLDAQTLKKIAQKFVGISKDDMTTLETAVACELFKAEYLLPEGKTDGETYRLNPTK